MHCAQIVQELSQVVCTLEHSGSALYRPESLQTRIGGLNELAGRSTEELINRVMEGLGVNLINDLL